MKILFAHENGTTAIVSPVGQHDAAQKFIFSDDLHAITEDVQKTDPSITFDEVLADFLQKKPKDVFPNMTRGEFLKLSPFSYACLIAERDLPYGTTDVRIVEDDAIPDDREFRDALTLDLTHDHSKCVEITKARLRAERTPKLAALDIEFLRALEDVLDVLWDLKSEKIESILDEKKRLRDVTKLAENAETLDDLRRIKA